MALREELVTAINGRLERAVRGDRSQLFDPDAVADAQNLTNLIVEGAAQAADEDQHVVACYTLGQWHWLRYLHLPEGQDQPDLTAAVEMFTICFIAGVADEALPEHLQQVMVDQAAAYATGLLELMAQSPERAMVEYLAQLWQRITTATPADHPSRGGRLSNLGIVLRTRFEYDGDEADLDATIAAIQEAVDTTPTEHPNRALRLNNLGSALHARFDGSGDRHDLDQAIAALRVAAQAGLADHPDRPRYLGELGNALQARFERGGHQADLDEAIDAFHAASTAASPDHPDRAQYLNNLGCVLHFRYERAGNPVDLGRAVAYGREAVDIAAADDPLRSMYLSNLGGALHVLFRRSGDDADLDQAITAGRQAVAAVSPGHPARAMYLNNLGNVLQARFLRNGSEADLDEAIHILHTAVQATPPNHPNRGMHLSNLGGSLQSRFERSGSKTDLDQGIDALRAAVDAIPADHGYHAAALNNLGDALRVRFEREGGQADLDEAIATLGDAVAALPLSSPNLPVCLNNLGGALRLRYELGGDRGDLDAAITVGRQAADATPTGHPHRAGHLSNLSNALQTRFGRDGDPADLDAAITYSRQAADVTPTDHPNRTGILNNLGTVLQTRFELGGEQADLDAAITAYTQAATTTVAQPSVRIRTARQAARLCAGTEPGKAAELLEQAVFLLPEVSPRRLRRADQQHMISQFAGLATEAVALALNDPAAPADIKAGRALRLLEAGRAVLLSQVLHTRSDLTDLTDRHPELAARFVALRDRLDQPAAATAPDPATPAQPLADDQHQSAADLADLLGQIRALDGFASFALPPTLDELQAQAAFGPVVTFNVSSSRSDALLLTGDGITALSLPGLDPQRLVHQVGAFYQALAASSDPRQDTMAAQDQICDILAWLWETVAEPVLRALGHDQPPPADTALTDWPRVWWAPGGLLGLLPIHAAGYHTDPSDPRHRTVLDRVISSYTPTINALRHARQQAVRAQPPPAGERALIVAMPTTPGLPRQGRLPQVGAEAALVAAHLPGAIHLTEPSGTDLAGSSGATEGLPTKSNVLAHLPGCSVVHFACHGTSDPADPSLSHLLLHDYRETPLTVAGLAPLNLRHARLAYLSACSTTLSLNTELLDEAIHLTSAFQMAGFPHVIGTLWTVVDEISADVARTFYATLAGTSPTSDAAITFDTRWAAHALHDAIRGTRHQFPRTPSLWGAYVHAGA